MGEHNERKEPKMYETIAPETRFVYIATTILEDIGQDPPENGGSVKVARWMNDQDGDHFKLQVSMGAGMFGEPKILFVLDHFSQELPANVPKNRYQLYSSIGGITPIKITDGKNVEKQYTTTQKKDAIRFLLQALTKFAPEDADKILNDAFSHRFESLSAVYALSDIALHSPASQLDSDLLQDIYVDYDMRYEKIKYSEITKAKKRKRSVVDKTIELSQPHYFEAVKEACDTSRKGPTTKNSYAAVDVYTAMVRVAREMNGKWRNTLTPESGTYPDLD